MVSIRLRRWFSIDLMYCCYFLRSISNGIKRFRLRLADQYTTRTEIHVGNMDNCFTQLWYDANFLLVSIDVVFLLGPAVIIWDWLPYSNSLNVETCDPPFSQNFLFLVITAFVEFFVPLISLTSLNFLVYLNIRQRSRGLLRMETIRLKSSNAHPNTIERKLLHTKSEGYSPSHYVKTTSLARDRRAAKNLFILVFAFVICWCPYTLLTLIRALCKHPDRCISSTTYEITFWLLWFNSSINPLLYSFLHVKFRQAFYRILCFYKNKYRQTV